MRACSLVHLDVVNLRLIDLAGQGRHTLVRHDWVVSICVHACSHPLVPKARMGSWPDLVCRRMPDGIMA
jgi:hypothetical protein